MTVEKGALGRKRAHIDNWTLLKMLSVLHNAFTDVLYCTVRGNRDRDLLRVG